MSIKPLFWAGAALAELRGLPAEARRQAGYELHRVQQGLEPSDWRPMPSVGAAVIEIRVHTDIEIRVFYVAKYREGVYVLHAFEKRSHQTSQHDIDLSRERLAAVLRYRRSGEETT
jgi:phage-related protein